MAGNLNLDLLFPHKYEGSAMLTALTGDLDELFQDIVEKIEGLADLVNPDLVSNEYMQYLADLLGATLLPIDSSSETDRRNELRQMIDWIKLKGTYQSVRVIENMLNTNFEMKDMYTNNYVDFVLVDWFVGLYPGHNPPGLDETYYKSPHFGYQLKLNVKYPIIEIIGDNIVTNGTFTGGMSSWSVGNRWVGVGDEAVFDDDGLGTAGQKQIQQSNVGTIGKTFTLIFDVTSWTAGTTLVVAMGSTNSFGINISGGVGTYSITELWDGLDSNILFQGPTNGDFSIDNVVIQEVVPPDRSTWAYDYLYIPEWYQNMDIYVEKTRPIHTVPHYYVLIEPECDDDTVVTTVAGEIHTKILSAWPSTKLFYDQLDSNRPIHDDGVSFFDQHDEAFYDDVTLWKIGTGSKGESPGDGGWTDLETVVSSGVVPAPVITADKVVWSFIIPAQNQLGISELGLYSEGPDTIRVASLFPNINLAGNVDIRVIITVNRTTS